MTKRKGKKSQVDVNVSHIADGQEIAKEKISFTPLPTIDTEPFKGKCPICSGQLIYSAPAPKEGQLLLTCSLSPSHYLINKFTFESAWGKVDRLMEEDIKNVSSEVINTLMSTLLENNIAENKPPVDPTKWRIGDEKTST